MSLLGVFDVKGRVLSAITALIPFLFQAALASENATWEPLYQQQSAQQNSMNYSSGTVNTEGSRQQQSGYFPSQEQGNPNRQSSAGFTAESGPLDVNGDSVNTSQFAPTVSAETAVTGATSGVDILDESLKFHSQQNAALMPQSTPSMQPSMAGGVNYNQFASANSQQNAFRNRGTAFNGSSSQGSGMQSGGGLNTQAIGAIGAAALVGTFLQSGGVGGMLRSVGWNNKRQVRGGAIGY
ncbi:MAG: hypothetical protein K2X93_23565 [Candidatus Obscuribacterales bacterium]|nr:hypothetical protein [Candidatus Obscuribacterales bacterium]